VGTDKYHIQVNHHLRVGKNALNEYDQYPRDTWRDCRQALNIVQSVVHACSRGVAMPGISSQTADRPGAIYSLQLLSVI